MHLRIDGVNAAELTKKVKLHANDPVANLPLAPTNGKPKEDLETKLKRLINARKCMLFMKGNPEEPKCGFSKQFVAIMKDINASYGTFDILTDDEVGEATLLLSDFRNCLQVRQGLKTFSNWPTFPQLYIDGDLIGGLDIIKEMLEAGELKDIIPTKVTLEERLKTLVNKAPLMIFMKGDRKVYKDVKI